MFIRSERLFLRPGWAEDWSELCTMLHDEGIVRNLVHAPWPCRPEHTESFLDGMQRSDLPRSLITLPTAAGSELVGCIWLEQRDDDTVMGCWIARNHGGKGYATEAVRAMLSLVQALGMQRVVARHFQDDAASARVLEKTGFRTTGRRPNRYNPWSGEQALSIEMEIHLGQGDGFDGGNATSMAA